MKRLLSTFLACMLCVAIGVCGINKTLNEAQTMFRAATTVAEYTTAKKKFQSARTDVGYVQAEHETAIKEGIRKCDERIYELSPRLTVNGSAGSTDISFAGSGGTRTLTISTNQGTPTASALPSWITVSGVSATSMTVVCAASTVTTSRSDWFTVTAGSKSVRVNVTQSAGREPRLEITGASFANTTKDDDILTSYGSTLYASEIRYLSWRVYYGGLSSSQTKSCKVKIIQPDGTLMTGSTSPAGYTYSWDITFQSGDNNTANAGGWGRENSSAYTAGTYRFEMWVDGSKLYSTTVTLQRKAGEATYLTVDNKTEVNASFDYDGDYERFYVSTDADSWDTWGVPSWCTVTDRTSTSFKIVCDANPSRSERSDYMKIKAGDKEVKINITQAGKPGPSATISNVRVDHNVLMGFTKGMRIHFTLDVEGMRGQRINVYCFFYYGDNTTQLGNGYGGQVQVSERATPSYDNSHWESFTLSMPYTALNMAPGWSGNLSFDIVVKDSHGNVLVRDENNQFQFTRGW